MSNSDHATEATYGRLLKTRRFLPVFLTQFLGAFNDNIFKNALIIMITYMTASQIGIDPSILVTAAAGIFIFPFFLFSALAGQLADRFDKSILIRRIKMVEICLMILATYGFYTNDIYFLLGVLFLMGVQSSFFGPLKYGILPDHLKKSELISANALVEASTFGAILMGTIVGGVFILKLGGAAIIISTVLMVACLGLLCSFWIPHKTPIQVKTPMNWNIFTASIDIVKRARAEADLFTAILGISWFWLVGFVFLAQLPVFGKDVLGVNEDVVTLFLTCFSIGIALGSFVCNALLKGQVRMTFAPIGAIGMAVFTILMSVLNLNSIAGTDLKGIITFLTSPLYVATLLCMVVIAGFGGLYVVPLYAVLQARSQEGFRARAIAANNIMNAMFMVAASIIVMILLKVLPGVPYVFLLLSLGNVLVAYLFWQRHKEKVGGA